jgi:dTDP-4-dehydrorhamnose 3,5-epimerase
MRFVPLGLAGVLLIQHRVFSDPRGTFFESWNERDFLQAGVDARFVQENNSTSARRVLRGLHYQVQHSQGKLIRVLQGEIFDVLVDLRRSSATFGASISVTLDDRKGESLWVPQGFAHGFLALADDTRVQYKVTDFWVPEAERTLAWDDPALAIAWPLPPGTSPILSAKDARGQLLAQAESFP